MALSCQNLSGRMIAGISLCCCSSGSSKQLDVLERLWLLLSLLYDQHLAVQQKPQFRAWKAVQSPASVINQLLKVDVNSAWLEAMLHWGTTHSPSGLCDFTIFVEIMKVEAPLQDEVGFNLKQA